MLAQGRQGAEGMEGENHSCRGAERHQDKGKQLKQLGNNPKQEGRQMGNGPEDGTALLFALVADFQESCCELSFPPPQTKNRSALSDEGEPKRITG